MGGKKKARSAFYDKKREISNGKKREAPDEGEKTFDRIKREHPTERGREFLQLPPHKK